MTFEEIEPFLDCDRIVVQCALPQGQEGVVALTGVPRAITTAGGHFFPLEGEEHLWLTTAFEHFIPFGDIRRIDPA